MWRKHFIAPFDFSLYDGYIFTASVPGFVISIFFEMAVGLALDQKLYRMRDTVTSLSTSLIMLIVGLFTHFLFTRYYAFFYQYRLFNPDESTWITWIGYFLWNDLRYYWFHRWSHEYNILWSAHSVHHSSEDFNLGTALRQSSFQGIWSNLMFYPINALIGFSLPFQAFHGHLNTVCQFWFHTTLIGNLGPLEYILNTPVQHSRHHSRVPGECNSNYAGVLSIWDQIFGTFSTVPSERWGLCEPAKSWNPIYDNFRHWDFMKDAILKRKTFSSKIKVFLRSGRFKNLKAMKMETKYRLPTQESNIQTGYLVFHHFLLSIDTLLFIDSFKKSSTSRFHLSWALTSILFGFYCMGSLFFFTGVWGQISKAIDMVRCTIYACGFLGFATNPAQIPGVLFDKIPILGRYVIATAILMSSFQMLFSRNRYLHAKKA